MKNCALKKISTAFVFLFFIAVGETTGKELVQNSISAADENADVLVRMINSGKKVRLKGKIYYVGSAKEPIHKNIYIKGPGTIITTTGNNLFVDSPVSIRINGVTLKTVVDISAGVQNRFIVNEGINYHKLLEVRGCEINGVRIFTHVASDVDQSKVLDGVKRVSFLNNTVSNIGDYILLLTNCRSDEVRIEKNIITRMYVMGFGLGVDNSFRDLGFARMKNVIFKSNTIDNSGLIITDADVFGSTYMTPLLCEADYCLCESNTFTHILATKHKPIALYPFYLSCRRVVIRNNYIEDCIHLADSSYNEMFKCKGGPGGAKDRQIIGNRYVITDQCLNLVPDDRAMPFIRFTCFQYPEMGNVEIRDNTVDVACDFVFGAGARCSYQSFSFENNSFRYNDIGPSSRQLIRLAAALNSGCNVTIRNNVMTPIQPAKDVFGIFLGDCSGYNFVISNNLFSGCLPTGEPDVDQTTPLYFTSMHNRVDLGESHSSVRISRGVSCDDTFTGGNKYTMYIYPKDSMQGNLLLHFEGVSPVNIMVFTRVLQSGNCVLTVSAQDEVKRYCCGMDESELYIGEYDTPNSLYLPKGERTAKQYVGDIGNSTGRLITDGEMIYYSTPDSAQGKSITVELKYGSKR